VTAKVFHIKEPELKTTRFGKSITLTTTTIADKTAKINLALWDDDGKKLKIGKSYNLSMLTVKLFENVKSLSMTSNSAMREVDDIGHLKVDVDQEPDNAITIEGVSTTVLLVPKHFCLQCNTPITVDPERSVVSCNKCCQKMLKKKP
jgi:ssDNA-binding replication factor A large subunit